MTILAFILGILVGSFLAIGSIVSMAVLLKRGTLETLAEKLDVAIEPKNVGSVIEEESPTFKELNKIIKQDE